MAYTPSVSSNLPKPVQDEFQRVARAQFDAVPFLLLTTSYAAPKQIKDGMIVKADGTHWNPGSGAGIYAYYGAAWHFLG
jgi:hypothetical protein